MYKFHYEGRIDLRFPLQSVEMGISRGHFGHS